MYIQKPLQEQAYTHLMQMINSGELKPDTWYSETKMCAEVGISRTPFRNALIRLSQNNYIDIVPSKGFRLHRLTKEDMVNIYQMRTAIEGYAAIYMAENREDPLVKKCLKKMQMDLAGMVESTAPDQNLELFFEFDYDFHENMIKATNNAEFSELYAMYQYRISSSAAKILKLSGRMQAACEEHRAILEAIEAGAEPSVLYACTQQHQSSLVTRVDEALGTL